MVTGQSAFEFIPEINTGFFFIQKGTPPCCKILTTGYYKLTLQG